jgi:membrane protease YdiL (CAAX protease family)
VESDSAPHQPVNDQTSTLNRARMSFVKWRCFAITVGIALFGSMASVVPFLAGHSLHRRFETVGKYLIYVSMGLLPLFIGAGALTYNFWRYFQSLQKKNTGVRLRSTKD